MRLLKAGVAAPERQGDGPLDHAQVDILGADACRPLFRTPGAGNPVFDPNFRPWLPGGEQRARAQIGRREMRGERLQWLRDAAEKRMAAGAGMVIATIVRRPSSPCTGRIQNARGADVIIGSVAFRSEDYRARDGAGVRRGRDATSPRPSPGSQCGTVGWQA